MPMIGRYSCYSHFSSGPCSFRRGTVEVGAGAERQKFGGIASSLSHPCFSAKKQFFYSRFAKLSLNFAKVLLTRKSKYSKFSQFLQKTINPS